MSEERRSYFDWRFDAGERLRLLWCSDCRSGVIVGPDFVGAECDEHGEMKVVPLAPASRALIAESEARAEVAGREAWHRVAEVLKDALLDLQEDAEGDGMEGYSKMADDALREAFKLPAKTATKVLRSGSLEAPR